MRVLHIHDRGGHIGGAETYIQSLSRLLGKEGVEQEFFYVEDSLKDAGNWIKKTSGGTVDPSLYFNRVIYNALESRIRECGPDIIHLHNSYLSPLTVSLALSSSKKPVVKTTHDYGVICPTTWCMYDEDKMCEGGYGIKCLTRRCVWPKRFARELLPWRLNWSLSRRYIKLFHSPSRALKEKLVSCRIKNVVHIPYFVYSEEYNSDPQGIENGNIIFVGGLFKHKGVGYLIRAFKEIRKNHVNSKLHIVGDGPEKENLINLSDELGVRDSTVFYGRVEPKDLPEFYRRANVVVFPSIWVEQSGIVGLEAMASGRPVVASNIGGILEWLRDGVNGFLVEPRDSSMLARKISVIISDSKLAVKLGRAGRRICEEEYDSKEHLPRIIKAYENAQVV